MAAHLKLLTDLRKITYLSDAKTFTSLRGLYVKILSDNATNMFVNIDNDFKKFKKNSKHKKSIQQYSASRKI